jgi:hypothetical protein
LLARKSDPYPAQLSDRGHVLMDNGHDLIVECTVTQATGTGERNAAAATWATPSRSMPGARSKRCLAGSRHSAGCASSRFVVRRTSVPCLACT